MADGGGRAGGEPAPDPRTLLANERTLLAWLRTGISLITFGFVIARLGAWMHIAGDGGREIAGAGWMGGLFVALGAAVDGVGITRYLLFHRALLSGAGIPTATTVVLTSALTIAALGAALGIVVLLGLAR
jgi:putative membrane protein